ncbi:hypothetical protein [Nostoc sp. CCY 9925]|uniref:hypothetical protein n=1 Tax=Nostoc sp. CCY 9925 TaxID=3103865 RepID=UPI0039C5D765
MRNLIQIVSLTVLVFTNLLVPSHPVAAQKACVVTDSGDVVCGKLQQDSKNPSTQNNQTIEFETINITLQGCKRSTSTVNCYFLLSPKKDGTGYFYCGGSKMFDTFAREYFCQQGQIGEQKGSNSQYTTMLKGIPLTAIATFREIPTQVKEISALQVGVNLTDYGTPPYQSAVFRSILVSE